jgi:hypothetical protein
MTQTARRGVDVGQVFKARNGSGILWRVVGFTQPSGVPAPHAYLARCNDPTTVIMIALAELRDPRKYEDITCAPVGKTG